MTHADVTAHRAGQLDGIRGICVLAVIFSHTISENFRIGSYVFFELGGYGVYMFFVLSAYLITGQLLVNRDARDAAKGSTTEVMLKFYARRALRLLPAYYLALAVAAAFDLPGIRTEWPWHVAQLTNFFFGSNQINERTSSGGHLWTLAVEWQFYLVWPFVILVLGRRAVLPSIVAMMLISSIIWIWDGWIPTALSLSNFFQSLFPLASGALLAYASYQGWDMRWVGVLGWPAAAFCLFGLSLFAFGFGATAELIGFPIQVAMVAMFVAIVHYATKGFDGLPGTILGDARLRYLGVISYGVYLYHHFIIYGWVKAVEGFDLPAIHWNLGFTLFITVLSVAAAAASWALVEKPLNAFRHHFSYRPATPPAKDGVTQP